MTPDKKVEKAPFVPPFVRFVASAIPMVFDDSMSYYECLAALTHYLQHDIVDVINNNATVTEEYIQLTKDMKEYMDNYFENLDVQEEINNKLDQMVEDGTLQEIIAEYIQANVAWTFNTVADMKASENLIAGSYAQTLGFHTLNDGGGATYYISDSGVANEMDVIAVGDLYANLVIPEVVTPEMFGAVGDGTEDDTANLNRCFAVHNRVQFGKAKTYKVTDTISIPDNFYIEGNGSTISGDLSEKALFENTSGTKGYCTGLTFTGGLNTAGFRVTQDSEAVIENCKFLSLGLYGASRFKVVRNCYFYNCARKTGDTNGQGMIYAGKDYVIYEGNEFYALDGDGLDHCIYAGGSQHHDIQILNNKCYALEGCTQGPLLALYPSTEVEDEHYHYNCIVKGNIFDYTNGPSSRAGIAISCQDSIIAENMFYGNGTSVASAYLNNSLRNTISNNKFFGGYINAEDCRNTLFISNTLKNCNNIGLGGVDNTKLQGFTIKGNKFVNTMISQRNSRYCSGVRIDGNHFTNLTDVGQGINLNQSSIASSDVCITNNIIENASGYGILCRYVEKIRVTGNTIINTNTSYTTNRGISFQYNTDYTGSIVTNNTLIGTFLAGYESPIRFINNGGIFANNTGGELGNGMLTAYPENAASGITNHSAWYIGELLNLSGTIYIAKSVGSGESDWVQLSN